MLVKKPFGPDIQLAIGSQRRSRDLHLKPFSLEVVNGHLVRGQSALAHREPHTVQDMVAVGLENHLSAARHSTGSQFGKRSLTGRVQMGLWILNDDQMIHGFVGTMSWCQQSNDWGETVAYAEAHVSGAKWRAWNIVWPGVPESGDGLISFWNHLDL